jgi:hypothetical protein
MYNITNDLTSSFEEIDNAKDVEKNRISNKS